MQLKREFLEIVFVNWFSTSLIELAIHWIHWQAEMWKIQPNWWFFFCDPLSTLFCWLQTETIDTKNVLSHYFQRGSNKIFLKAPTYLRTPIKGSKDTFENVDLATATTNNVASCKNSSTKTDPLFWCCKVTALLNEKAIFFKFIFNDLFLCHNIHRVAKDSKVCSLAQVLLPSFPTVFENYKNVSWFTTKILSETFLWVFKHH